MAYQKEKVEPKGIVKVGDVFCGDYGYNRCSPTFYKVVRLTKKMVEVKELNKAYRTPYMSNTVGDFTVPVIDDVKFDGYDYIGYMREQPNIKASVYKMRWDDHAEETCIRVNGHNYYPWDGEPMWVNCD